MSDFRPFPEEELAGRIGAGSRAYRTMVGRLTQRMIEDYRRDGFVAPLRVLPIVEAERYRARLEAFESARGRALDGLELHKSYLIFTWLDELVRCPAVLDAVETLIGPDILVFSSSLFIKAPRDARFISWHQDSTYWRFEPHEVVTVWLALTPSTRENGCVRMAPGSHRHAQLAHEETRDANNMLTRGQVIATGIDPKRAVDVELAPGELSLHHAYTAHASGPNRSAQRRIGFAVRYLPAHVRQTGGPPLTAMLVRGVDRYRHFEPERGPSADLEPEAVAFHRMTMDRHRATAYSTV